MENIAVHCSWADAQLSNDPILEAPLSAELKNAILNSSGTTYLDALASAALIPGCTDRIFTIYQPLTSEIAARWLRNDRTQSLSTDVNILSCLARIFPFARYLRPCITTFLQTSRLGSFSNTGTLFDLADNDTDTTSFLLALFRLLSTEPACFRDAVKPTFLCSFLNHESKPVRYLAIQCFCIVMRFADLLCESLIKQYVGDERVEGIWEGKDIDLRLLKLLEEKRWMQLRDRLVTGADVQSGANSGRQHELSVACLSTRTADIGGVLVPRADELKVSATSFVNTHTATTNLKGIGQALLKQKPVLVTGVASSGKTTLIMEAARLLNKHDSMITLHLNEQTDAKSLLGVHTSSSTGESFVWQAGVLTKAVQQGRWVLIEDIDRAPAEVLGMLRPIIENGELFLPSRKERIRPAEGFRVFATIKTSFKSDRANYGRHAWLSNTRLWNVVQTEDYVQEEIEGLVKARYPQTTVLASTIIEVHNSVCLAYRDDMAFRAVQSRLPSLRDLLKWCRRISRRLRSDSDSSVQYLMTESAKLDIFKDAIDCYAAFHSDENVYLQVSQRIASAMNISPQQVDHILKNGMSDIIDSKSRVALGRSVLRKVEVRRHNPPKKATFAMTNLARRMMESIAAGISYSEPLLLVGETGVGKTTIVQHIANLVNQKLTVVNLSQQSEATDLLGGLKPITTRSLIIPLVDQFNALFDDTFSNKRNEKFRIAIAKAVAKQNWQRLILLWQEALQMANNSLKKPFNSPSADSDNQAVKKRKISSRHTALYERWTDFSSRLNQIRAQVERGDKNHTFAFVEGRLVQAVRGGEWLLLDEINLASADTLDHIIGLLRNGDDGQPSLLLTEAGNIEQIQAHPDFRIFAAMNPATDTGKKDLAPGLRSRFTEIYVHSGDSDINDLVKIIETYLGILLSGAKRAAVDLAEAYMQLKKLNEQHKLTDGAGDAPHFSIRSLVRCLLYVIQHTPSHGLRRSMYEGFAMSFFTVLSKQSEDLASPVLNTHLLAGIKNPRSFLSQQPKMPFDENEYIAFRHHIVLRGINSPDFQPHYIRTPSVERNLLNLARAASMRRFPILLQGPTSAGKTSMVEYLAKLSGNIFVRINNHEHTDLQEYLGSYATGTDGKLEFREGVLVEALRKGHWVVLDELNLAPSDVLEALNRLLDDNRELLIPESQEVVRPHPGFMLFATQNPAGLYGGRKRLSRAFRNRFLELHFDDIPEDELEVILQKRAQIAPTFCTEIVQVYKKLSLQRQSARLFEQRNSFATLRDLFRWAARPADDRQQLAYHGFMLLGERVRDPAERLLVKRTIEETMRVKIDESALYSQSVIPSTIQSSGVVWTPAMTRLFVLVTSALKNNEPVLLVGETGCGKTQICQTVAQAFERVLSIYNAHSNTETGDLIGSQRPIRQRTDLANAVLNNITQLAAPQFSEAELRSDSIEGLIENFNKMDTSALDPDVIERTRQSIGAYQSLFAWNDGNLIRAMKAGEHFLLDEISLADDSVLERLNSLLEPSRAILLAEKGPDENYVVADPQFQFLATMNPGGDYGKRELSAALRNRLTEIWVPSLSQDRDILPILQTKLGQEYADLAPLMLDFATWFRDEMQSSATSTIPLRSLLTWAEFIKKNASLPPKVAFVHGAAMVYIDSLGANPAGLTSSSAGDVETARRLCLTQLQAITSIDTFAIYSNVPDFRLLADQLQLGAFSLQRTSQGKDISDLVFGAPTTLRNSMRIVRALQMYRPILLEGSPGVGKTAIVTALAEAIGKPLTRINLSDQTDLMDLFGADAPSEDEKVGNFAWRDGPLLQAMQSGGWVLLDEMNLASQSVLEGLNSCLDHRHEVYIAELDKSFTCHPEFTLFAAQNPHHQGGGRKGLPASFVNRFTVVYTDSFEKEDLLRICREKRPLVPDTRLDAIIDTISEGHALITKSAAFGPGGPWELNLRDINRWLDLCEAYPTLPPAFHFSAVLSQRFRGAKAKELMLTLCRQFFPDNPESSLYHNLSTNVFQLGTTFLQRHETMQHVESSQLIPPGHLPYARSMITALNHGWPIILVGPSGCGKTQTIHSLAALSGATLVEFSMNADIDTMDLIGGFEQHDPRRDITELQKEICETLTRTLVEAVTANPEISLMLCWLFEQCSAPDPDAKHLLKLVNESGSKIGVLLDFQQRLQSMVTSQDNMSSRFVWNDGILINALQEGSWLVLDNANLCNSSVLDRLNSLLEPNGVLVVSEQHNSGQSERVIKPHPNFRIFLTMDPKYGELSRAMRNRSLELFIDNESTGEIEPSLKFPIYTTTASVSRLRHLLLHPSDSTKEGPRFAIQPYVSNLSSIDLSLCRTELKRVSGEDLYDTDLVEEVTRYLELSEDTRNTIDQLSNSLADRMKLQIRDDIVRNQPQLPIINDALLVLTTYSLVKATHITRLIQLNLQKLSLAAALREIQETAKSTKKDRMTLIEQSLVTIKQKSKSQQPSILPVFQFLTAFIDLCDGGSLNEADLIASHQILNLVRDLVQVFSDRTVDPGTFQAYLQIVDNLIAECISSRVQSVHGLHKARALIPPQYTLQYGTGLQRMWTEWKPDTASNQEQLEALLNMEDLIVEFDQLTMKLPQRRSALASVRSRLLQTRATITSEPDAKRTIVNLSQAIKDLAKGETRRKAQSGLFAPIFDWLLVNLTVQQAVHDPIERQKLCLLAHNSSLYYPSSADRPLQRTIKTLALLNRGRNGVNGDEIISSSAAGNELISYTSVVVNQSLNSLDSLEEEVQEMTKSLGTFSQHIGSESLAALRSTTTDLAHALLNSHIDILKNNARSHLKSKADLSSLVGLSSAQVIGVDSQEAVSFGKVYDEYLKPIVPLLADNTMTGLVTTGKLLINISLAALNLMVPDKAFDPAVYPALVQQRHISRTKELQSKINSYRAFQRQFTGQDGSMLIHMFELDLVTLGEVPVAPTVVRPKKSELSYLQAEFTNVIRGVIESHQARKIAFSLEEIKNNYVEVRASGRSLLKTISINLSRLSNVSRAYDDLVKPVCWLLESLSLGIKLLMGNLGDSKSDTIRNSISRLPMLGAGPEEVMLGHPSDLDQNVHTKDVLLQHLESLTVHREIEGKLSRSDASIFSIFLGLVRPLYLDWKGNLSKDQIEAEAKARYYAYRGEDEAAHEVDEGELAALFPTFDKDVTADEAAPDQYDARATAVRIASIHQRLFSTLGAQGALRHNILLSLKLANNKTLSATHEKSSLADLLPGIFLQLDQSIRDLSARDATKPFNIYADTDINEVRKLLRIVNDVQTRFEAINEQWPEHAVPIEVLSFCEEVLAFKINEPVAKLLTKTEKLLEIVAQWQSVASREWSVANLVETLTNLIISWRRLELSSWSRLLDLERQKNDEAASAWYFIAYEAVIENSRLVVEQTSNVTNYCQELASTVEEFLKTTTTGQFSSRLRLLSTLQKTLGVIAVEDTRLLPIIASLSSVLSHYQRYEAQVQQNLITGRAGLEKNIKEQIQLASWKDTNIASLRDSARRTHFKLFKIVKKYRALLSQPMTSFKTCEDNNDFSVATESEVTAPDVIQAQLQTAVLACDQTIPDWLSRPERLRDPVGASLSMRRVYQQNNLLNLPLELASFREDVSTTARELRKQTPQTLTEDNKSLVRHLRERKRRLLADTMKSLIHMGVRRNLGTTDLGNQTNMSVVLANSPDLMTASYSNITSAATNKFHEILDIIPGARSVAREHSDDLTDGEVNRGLGLLEGILSIAISQRISLGRFVTDLEKLNKCLECLTGLQKTSQNDIVHAPLEALQREEWLLRSSCWLIELLPLSCHILEFQAHHAGIDVTSLVSVLQDFTGRIRTANAQINEYKVLPVGLCDQSHLKALDDCEAVFGNLRSDIKTWQLREPKIDYLLRQIVPWTLPRSWNSANMNGVVKHDINVIDNSSRQVLDQCFVVIQRLANIQSAVPESTEDAGWLVKTDKALADMTKTLHINDITSSLEETLSQLHHLDKEDITLATSVLTVASPVLHQYQKIAQHIRDRHLSVHLETCRVGALLSRSFVSLVKEGFCTPSEPSKGEDQSGKLESGTGLGEGEGAEDISKDVGDDEDLSELAQNGEKQDKDDGAMDKSKDAVDMGADDLDGEMGSDDEKEDEDGDVETGSEDENDMDEETGSVDELDPSAVDEKMWDDARNEAEKEEKDMKSEKAKGDKSDEQTAKNDDSKQDDDNESGEMDNEPEGEATDAEDDVEGQGRPEAENLDPRLQEEEALEIPEDIQFDNADDKDDDISDNGMDEMSDIDQLEGAEPEQVDNVSEPDKEENKDFGGQDEEDATSKDDEQQDDGKAEDDTVMEDQPEDDSKENEFDTHEDEMQYDLDNKDGGDTGAANQQDQADDQENQATQGQNDTEVTVDEQKTQTGQPSEQEQKGDAAAGAVERGAGREDEQKQRQDDALQKLADVLEEFHQRREILTASEERKQGELDQDVDMNDADFEHIGEDEEEESDAQALGTAAADQAQKLDQSKAIEDHNGDADQDLPMPEEQDLQDKQAHQESIAERFSRLQGLPREQREDEAGALMSQPDLGRRQPKSLADTDVMEEDVEDADSFEIINGHDMSSPPTSSSDAAALWAHCSTRTHALSLLLTEQLRLILAPTTATKLRGDFRTGKRLNIKRIIPYIASGYKRDKIWMRRSVPSKRNYQIMIAVDDSKSMSESGADLLAFETLAMLCKSLSMLEVGDLCIVSFGEEQHIRVAHPFGNPFTSAESGTTIFKNFSFNQKGTDVRKLVRESISIFQDARLRSPSQASDDLWQLQLIVSDGHCSDHDTVRRLVRAAHEQKIMIVFVIVDAGKDSIVDLKEATFEREDPLDPKSELKVKTKRYLEGFPFQYYVVVRNVGDLPGVLARVLKGWFEGVVDVQ